VAAGCLKIASQFSILSVKFHFLLHDLKTSSISGINPKTAIKHAAISFKSGLNASG